MLLIVNLVATPFTIRLLGAPRYGLWALLQLSLTWAVLADVGMASASTKFSADRYALRDDQGESAVVWTALIITGITTSCVGAAVAIGAPLILAHLLHLRGELLSQGVVALRIVCCLFVVNAVAGTINTPQVVRLRWRAYSMITVTAALIASIGTPIALVLVSRGVVTAAAVGLVAAALGALGSLLLAVRLLPALRRPRVNKVILRQLLAYGGALTVSGVALIPLLTAERFFLARNHSTVVVAYYAVAATLATTLNVLPQQLVGPLLPGLTRLEAEGRLEEHRDLYRKSLIGLYLVLTPAAIMFALLAQPFLSLWAGPEYGIHSTGPFIVIVAGVWFNCFCFVPYTYLLSSGRTKIIAYVQVAEVVPYLAAAWVLTAKYGAIGAALAWSAMFAVDVVVFFAVVRRVAGLPLSPLPERRLRSIAVPVVLAFAVLIAATVSRGLVVRVGWAAGLSMAYAVTTWLAVLTTGERQGLLRVFDEVVRPGLRRKDPELNIASSRVEAILTELVVAFEAPEDWHSESAASFVDEVEGPAEPPPLAILTMATDSDNSQRMVRSEPVRPLETMSVDTIEAPEDWQSESAASFVEEVEKPAAVQSMADLTLPIGGDNPELNVSTVPIEGIPAESDARLIDNQEEPEDHDIVPEVDAEELRRARIAKLFGVAHHSTAVVSQGKNKKKNKKKKKK